MFEHILVPVDGSELSQRAVAFAQALASEARGQLVLVRAAEAHPFPGADAVSAQVDVLAAAERETEVVCDGLTARGAAAEWHVYYGAAATAIEDEVKLRGADSIVMSTHGRGGLAKLVYGSVAQQVVARSTVPVLLIPAMCRQHWPAAAGGRVLVPLDQSTLAEAAIEPAIILARRLSAGLILLGLVQPATAGYGPVVYPRPNTNAELQTLNEYLSGVAAKIRARGMLCSTAADVGNPATAIAELATVDRIVGLAMATHGRTGLAQVVMGSIATSTVQKATVPVLLVRPAAVRQVEAQVREPAAIYAT